MREYKIAKSDLWWIIYRKLEKDWSIFIRFYGWKNNWVLNKSHAKNFYHREDALSNLALVKYKNEKKSD